MWAARTLLVVAVLVIVLAVVTRSAWAARGFDVEGTPRALLPNIALGCALVLGIGWPWFSGLAASSSAVRRAGDDLVAVTVLGTRRVRLVDAFIVRFRLLTNVGTLHGTFVVDRRCRPLVVLDPWGAGAGGRVREVTGEHRYRAWRVVAEHLLGVAWLLSTVVVVFLLTGSLFAVVSGPAA